MMKTAILLLALPGATLAAQTGPCCAVTAIDAVSGVVSAKVSATGNGFEFKPANKQILSTLKVGQAVYANFTTHQVSIDGRAACCTVTSGPSPDATAARGATTAPATARPAAPAVSTKAAAISLALPKAEYGDPHPPLRSQLATQALSKARYDTRSVVAMIGGRSVTGTVLHLRGLDGIENAPGLPDGARRLLEMHVRKLQPGESDHYVVNLDLATKWIADHPVPADIHPTDEDRNTHSGCNKWTWHCAGEVAAHAADQATQLIQQAQADWDHASGELAKDWNSVPSCFADATLPLSRLLVKFSTAPGMTVDLSSKSTTSFDGGTASTTVQGSVGLSFPLAGDFDTQLDLFYIPCLPFVVRPKSLAAQGTLTAGEDLKASASASGQFDKTFTIPPTGGPRIPIEVYPIVIAGVPVAEMDVSAYVEGNVEVAGKGTIAGQVEVKNPHKAAFDFSCSGHGCSGNSHGMPDPTTATESASLKGVLSLRPDIFTALQLDFDVDALSARAGPQPYLLGQAAGCEAVAAGQSSNGTSSGSENHLLAADLDWGVDLRAEALVADKVVGDSYRHSFTANKHLWFRDLVPGGSTGLDALVTPVGQAVANKPATYKVRMPSCYPYAGLVKYQITWTGGGAPAANSACAWKSGEGSCSFDPTKDLVFVIAWPGGASHTLSVTAVGDNHDNTTRQFEPAPKPTQLTVTVPPEP